jgi:hypothetical protein
MILWFLLLPVQVTVCSQGWAIPVKISYYCAISPLMRLKMGRQYLQLVSGLQTVPLAGQNCTFICS